MLEARSPLSLIGRTTPVLALMLASVLPLPLQAAEVYRWVDEQGLVNYSSVAPRGVAYERVDPGARPRAQPTLANPRTETAPTPASAQQTTATTAAAPAAENDLDLTAEQRERRAALQAEAESRRQRLEAERRQQCERARQQYEELTTYTRVRVVGEDGRERMLSEDELQSRIAAARDAIVTNCD